MWGGWLDIVMWDGGWRRRQWQLHAGYLGHQPISCPAAVPSFLSDIAGDLGRESVCRAQCFLFWCSYLDAEIAARWVQLVAPQLSLHCTLHCTDVYLLSNTNKYFVLLLCCCVIRLYYTPALLHIYISTHRGGQCTVHTRPRNQRINCDKSKLLFNVN